MEMMRYHKILRRKRKIGCFFKCPLSLCSVHQTYCIENSVVVRCKRGAVTCPLQTRRTSGVDASQKVRNKYGAEESILKKDRYEISNASLSTKII